jgi:hypothetical protein
LNKDVKKLEEEGDTMKKQRMTIFIAVLIILVIAMYIIPKTAEAATECTYVDENGTTHTANATVLSNETTQLSTGWYIVKGNVSTTNLIVRGDARIILEDGSVLNAGATGNHAGIEVINNSLLTVYGQEQGTGKLNATGSGRGAGIGGYGGTDTDYAQAATQGGDCGTITIVSGIVNTNRIGGGDGGKGLNSREDTGNGGRGGNSGTITIKGGHITVTEKIGGGSGGESECRRGGDGGNLQKLTITGGIVNTVSIGGGDGGKGNYYFRIFEGLVNAQGKPGNGGSAGNIVFDGGKVNVSGNIRGGNAGVTSFTSLSTPGSGGNGSAITVNGGTINVSGVIGGGSGSPFLNSPDGDNGSCVITGGSFYVRTLRPTPTNGNQVVSLTTVTLADDAYETKVKYINATYKVKDMNTNSEGKIYIWLPGVTAITHIYAGRDVYTGVVDAGTTGVLSKMSRDVKKPTVISVLPASGSVNIPASGIIIIKFSEIIDIVGTVTLVPTEGSNVVLNKGTWSSNNTTYNVPYTNLTKGMAYNIVITGFKDFAENTMDKDESYDFRVEYPVIIPTYDYSYVDETGEIKTAKVYKVDSTKSVLTTGWYAVEGNLVLNNLNINGNVRLILTDGSNLTVNGTGHSAAIRVGQGNVLSIYGQAQGTGKISAISTGRGAGIGGIGNLVSSADRYPCLGEDCGTVNINGGTVTTNRIGGGDADKLQWLNTYSGGRGGTITINGGTVIVSDRIGGGNGGDGVTGLNTGGRGGNGSNITINGGTVIVSGKIGGGLGGKGSMPPFYIPSKAGEPGTCVITGGSLQVGTMQPTPKNNNVNLSLTTVSLSGVTTSQTVKAVVTNLQGMYGTRDMKTDTSGKLFLWLPTGTTVTEVYLQGKLYRGSVQTGQSGTLSLATIDTQKPVITQLTPDDNEKDVPLSGKITITFSKVMDISKGTITIANENITAGQWTYSGTVYTVNFSELSYSSEYIVSISGFEDISGNKVDTRSFTFTTAKPPKKVSVGTQSSDLINGTAKSITFTVDTVSIEGTNSITLNNINNIPGVTLETLETTGDSTTITIKTTAETPAGTHPFTLTIDGVTSNSFNLVVDVAIYSILLSQTEPYVFNRQTYGYQTVESHNITVMNTGNTPTGVINIAITGEGFILSNNEISSIDVNNSNSFTITPNEGLSVGEYTATVTVSGANIATQSFDVSFTVNKRTGNNIISVINPTNATIAGTNIMANVKDDVSSLQLELSVSDGASWKLYGDITCLVEIADKTMSLEYGANIAFAEVTAESGSKKIYVFVIVRVESLLQNPMNLIITEKDGTIQLETDLVNVTWSIVSGQECATINETGVVTAKENGIVVIRANTQDEDIYQEFEVIIRGQSTNNPNTGDDTYSILVFFVLFIGALLCLLKRLSNYDRALK